jgi:hypothetical protein
MRLQCLQADAKTRKCQSYSERAAPLSSGRGIKGRLFVEQVTNILFLSPSTLLMCVSTAAPVRCANVPRPSVHYEAQDRDDAV